MFPGSQPGGHNSHSLVQDLGGLSRGSLAVCHVASGDLWAGAEVQIAGLLKHLSRREGIRVCAIFLNDGRLADEVRRSAIQVEVIPEAEKSFFQIFFAAARFLKGRNIRIIHSHRYKENLLASLLAWKCSIPAVVRTQHGFAEPFTGFRHLRHRFLHGLDNLAARYATDCVIGVSSEMCDQLARRLGPQKVVLIHNGLDLDRDGSASGREEAKRRLALEADTWIVGTAGRLVPVKRLDIFLRVASILLPRYPRARFLVAGIGGEEGRLRQLAASLRLDDRVRFLGARDDIYDVLRAMDVFVLCSDHEGLPMVLLEALRLGVAVVARQVGGVREVIRDGVNGILLDSAEPSDLAEACACLLEDDSRRRAFAEAGPRTVEERFTAQQNAEQVAQLYLALSGKV